MAFQASPNLFRMLAPITTAVGSWGGFPEPPIWFKQLAQNEWFQYAMLYVLIYQGAGAANPKTSLIFTILFFLIKKFLDKPLPGKSDE